MKGYLRRLWAALLNRDYTPLEIGDPIAFRSPGGTPLVVEIANVSVHQDIDRVMRLSIEAQSPVARMRR